MTANRRDTRCRPEAARLLDSGVLPSIRPLPNTLITLICAVRAPTIEAYKWPMAAADQFGRANDVAMPDFDAGRHETTQTGAAGGDITVRRDRPRFARQHLFDEWKDAVARARAGEGGLFAKDGCASGTAGAKSPVRELDWDGGGEQLSKVVRGEALFLLCTYQVSAFK